MIQKREDEGLNQGNSCRNRIKGILWEIFGRSSWNYLVIHCNVGRSGKWRSVAGSLGSY